MTTVAPFGQSIRHIVVAYESSLGDAGLAAATNLVTLDCTCNPKITSIAFCQNSLQELTADGEDCGLQGDEIAEAPLLRKVQTCASDKITYKHLEGFTQVGYSTFVR